MKKLVTMTAAVVALVAASPVWALKIGDKIPNLNIQLVSVDGKTTTVDAVKGTQGTLVFFTCNHCPYSKAWEARYTKFGNELLKKGFGVIAINSNDVSKAKEDSLPLMGDKSKRLGMRFAYVADQTSDVARAFGAQRTPEFFLFDKEGSLIYTGAFDDNAEHPAKVRDQYLSKAVKAYSKNKPIQVAETRSVGCSIKFRSSAANRTKKKDVY